MMYTLLLEFSSDDPETNEDLKNAIMLFAPYMVDNVAIHLIPHENNIPIAESEPAS